MAKSPSDGWNPASRRRFLQALGWTGMASMLAGPGLLRASALPRLEQYSSAFAEIPASISGISWAHVNGRSPMAYLPETGGGREPRALLSRTRQEVTTFSCYY